MDEDNIEFEENDENERHDNNYILIDIINAHFTIISNFKEVDFSALYDESDDDKIKCITGCYKVIEAAQNAIIDKIKRQP